MKKPVQGRSKKGRDRCVHGAGEQLPNAIAFTGRGVEGQDSQKIIILEKKKSMRLLHAQRRKTAATETLVSENEKVCTMPLSLMVSFNCYNS